MGKVALVGAGPGDPGLITARGLELLRRASVVVCDYLVEPGLLARVSADAKVIDVGKRPGRPFDQRTINQLLVDLSHEHPLVVRLKGGDPFVLGRGGEEVEALLAAGVQVEVVPGVSSSLAGPLLGGFAVTHRGISDGYLVITGHRHTDEPLQYDWQALAQSRLTLLVLMGVAHRSEIATGLIEGGMSPATPVAVITSASWPGERVALTRLDQLPSMEFESPSVIVIGDVVGNRLDWRRSAPLGGRTVVVTRPRLAFDPLVSGLVDLGATVIENPAVAISDPSDEGAGLSRALAQLDKYAWIVFTSRNSVLRVLPQIGDLRRLASVKVAAIGVGTAGELERFLIRADLVPSEFVGEELVAEFPAGSGKVLFPRARIARDVVVGGLRAKGWEVDLVEAYQSEVPAPVATPQQVEAADLAVFTASSTVDGFLQQFGGTMPRFRAAIGPVTAARLGAAGYPADVVAEEYSTTGLLDAICTLFANRTDV